MEEREDSLRDFIVDDLPPMDDEFSWDNGLGHEVQPAPANQFRMFTNPQHYLETNDPEHALEQNLGGQEQKGGFRFCAKSLLATYPHCDVSKEEMLVHFQGTLCARVCVVAEERHADGSPHLHVYAEFDRKIDTRNCRYFDYEGYHPNLQRARPKQLKKTLSYVIKDGNFVQSEGFDVQAVLDSKKSKLQITCEQILLGKKTLTAAVIENPCLLMSYDKLKRNLQLYEMDTKSEVHRDVCYITSKKRHAWIFGKSNTGKSTMLRSLIDYNPGDFYEISDVKDWTGYNGQRYLYYDEYKGQLTIQELNKLCDGDCSINIKYSKGRICKWPMVIICSNFSIRACYDKVDASLIETLKNRFNEIEFTFKFN